MIKRWYHSLGQSLSVSVVCCRCCCSCLLWLGEERKHRKNGMGCSWHGEQSESGDWRSCECIRGDGNGKNSAPSAPLRTAQGKRRERRGGRLLSPDFCGPVLPLLFLLSSSASLSTIAARQTPRQLRRVYLDLSGEERQPPATLTLALWPGARVCTVPPDAGPEILWQLTSADSLVQVHKWTDARQVHAERVSRSVN